PPGPGAGADRHHRRGAGLLRFTGAGRRRLTKGHTSRPPACILGHPMTTEPTPDEIRRATFRVVFRGYDQAEVESRLHDLGTLVEQLTEQRDRLASRLGEFAERDLKSEFEVVGREVASVLEAARAAAETMRDRAGADAARWRSEAMAEVESMRKSARADAEALRTDAWTTSSQLLEQVVAEVERTRAASERDSLAVMGEAEREAHRLTSTARREAEEVVRAA